MAIERYQTLDLSTGKTISREALVESAGSGDGGKIPALEEATGKFHSSVMPAGFASDTTVAPASENLSAGDFVNLWDDSGTVKVRKADASDPNKAADGFVEANVTAPANATVVHDGTNSFLSGLTPVEEYFLSASSAGDVTDDVSGYGSGDIVQSLGKAKSATALIFERGEPIEIE